MRARHVLLALVVVLAIAPFVERARVGSSRPDDGVPGRCRRRSGTQRMDSPSGPTSRSRNRTATRSSSSSASRRRSASAPCSTVRKWDSLRAYLSPRFGYQHSSLDSLEAPAASRFIDGHAYSYVRLVRAASSRGRCTCERFAYASADDRRTQATRESTQRQHVRRIVPGLTSRSRTSTQMWRTLRRRSRRRSCGCVRLSASGSEHDRQRCGERGERLRRFPQHRHDVALDVAAADRHAGHRVRT